MTDLEDVVKKKKFPKEVFLKWEDIADDAYLSSHHSIDTVAEQGMLVPVGIYKLVEVKKVHTLVTVK